MLLLEHSPESRRKALLPSLPGLVWPRSGQAGCARARGVWEGGLRPPRPLEWAAGQRLERGLRPTTGTFSVFIATGNENGLGRLVSLPSFIFLLAESGKGLDRA